MKKTLIAVLATASLLFAESYQVNTLSAKQMGMAHTGAGMKLGSESMNFNPGGLGFLDKKLDVSAGATFIIPRVEVKVNDAKTVSSKLGVPFYVYAASSIADRFSAGLSFTTPYGNSANYGKGWEGANLLQDISLAVYALQPTVAYKPMSQFSMGVGPVIYSGSFVQNKRMVPGGNVGGNINAAPLASAKFSGDADVALGVNAGILYDILQDKLALGVGYRSEAKMKVAKGKTKMTYSDPDTRDKIISSIPLIAALDGSTFETELPLPANLNTGVSFRPMEKLLLAFDWQWIFWNTYDSLSLAFTNGVPFYKSVSQKKYHNTFAYRLGAQYALIDQLDVRFGTYYDESPVDNSYLTPESPSTDKLGLTIGASYRPITGLSIDASLLRAFALSSRKATSGTKVDNYGSLDGLDARYKVTAWVPSIGLSYNF